MEERYASERTRLCVLFFLHANALGLWSVNLSNVLKAHGYEALVGYPPACISIAALISPLAVGAIADQRMAPERVLRRLGLGAALFLSFLYFGIAQHWHSGWILVLAQIHALWSAPTFGLTTSLILSRLRQPHEEFGGVRLWGTLGWMSAGGMVSWVLAADESVRSGYAGSVVWLLTIAFSFALPPSKNPVALGRRSVREQLGLDALHLLRHHDHGIVFITAGLLNMVLAAFYPFTPLHLEDLGIRHVTSVMSLGQITEMIAMLGLAAILARFQLKWVFLTGLGFAVLRYALFAWNAPLAVVGGVVLHGFCFTLFIITTQIYLERRVDPGMRARAQALLTMVTGGLGNLVGSLGSAAWRRSCQAGTVTDWRTFWTGMTAASALVFIFFALTYRGNRNLEDTASAPEMTGEDAA